MPHGPKSGHNPQPMTADGPMTATQESTLKRLAQDAYELDAFKPNLTRAEAEKRIAMLTAKLKLLDEPPHTL
jgi:glyoxylate carboligase